SQHGPSGWADVDGPPEGATAGPANGATGAHMPPVGAAEAPATGPASGAPAPRYPRHRVTAFTTPSRRAVAPRAFAVATPAGPAGSGALAQAGALAAATAAPGPALTDWHLIPAPASH